MNQRKRNRALHALVAAPIVGTCAAITILAIAKPWNPAFSPTSRSGIAFAAAPDGWGAADRIAAVCHDGVWEAGEFCGRDAYVTTGTPDMNHDCVVNWLDQGLFQDQIGAVGANLSADLNDSGAVDSSDLAIFGANYGETATPCTAGPIGTDACQGTIALSFNADPRDIDPTWVLGAPGLVEVFLVADDIADARAVQYSLRITGSVTVFALPGGGADTCTDAATKQYFRTIYLSTPTAGPVVLGSFFLNVTALTPVTLKLQAFTSPCAYGGQRQRWTDSSFNRSIDFASVRNAAINGTVPFAAETCASPNVATVTDIPNDQGRQVRVTFSKCLFDAGSATYPVQQYEAFRRVDAIAKPGVAGSESPAWSSGERVLRAARQGMISDPSILMAGWDYVGAVPAHREETYSFVAPTLVDSTVTDGIAYSAFFVRAATSNSGRFFDSNPDSGYSVDNLAPAVPLLTASYTGTGFLLEWEPSPDPDVQYYKVYRGSSPDFEVVVGSDVPVHQTVDTQWLDTEPTTQVYYKISAVDFSGNEGRARSAGISTDVGDRLPKRFALYQNVPNPFNPATMISFDLVREADVALVVLDASGRLVRSLLRGRLPAKAHSVLWDGLDDSGAPVSSGVYFYRLESEQLVDTRKMVLVR